MNCALSIPIGLRILDSDMETLGDLVRRAREQRTLSATQLAAKLGVSQSTLSRIENNRIVEAPEPRLVQKFEDVLGIPQDVALRSLGYNVGPAEPTSNEVTDPVLAELITDLRRLPLTGKRPAALRGLIDVFLENERRQAKQPAEAVHE